MNFTLISLPVAATLALTAPRIPSSETAPTAEAPDFPYVGLERVFPELKFERPVYLTGAGDGSGRLFVVEQHGVIRVFDEDSEASDAEVFLDISHMVSRKGNEEGLLGLAFHPDFASNGEFFVHFSSTRDADDKGIARNVISRYRVDSADGDRADVESEEILLTQRQPYRNHNGGHIAFGPDGYLYASFGDGGAGGDPEGNGQKLSSILGSIIRIDVDSKSGDLAYGIPDDNPFLDVEGARPELWAIGLRNVWRFAFDRKDGTLIAGDVGQNKLEEVDVIVPGGNYGWNMYEADEIYRERKKQVTEKLVMGEHVAPIATYPRSDGISITGGYTYRGEAMPELQGLYFFADYVSGRLWASRPNGDGSYTTELMRKTGRTISSFGESDDGELFALSFDGGVYRLALAEEADVALERWPRKLSDTGLYASVEDRTLSDDLIAYEVNVPFWSDGVEKGRYLKLPTGTAATLTESGTFELPVGAKLVKTFDSGGKPLETRVIERLSEGWAAATYVWNLRGTKATLRPEGKRVRMRGHEGLSHWLAPSSTECSSCHVAEAGFALSLNAAQLHRDVDGESQLAAWLRAGHLEVPDGVDLSAITAFPALDDESASLETRARVYLDVNCAMCHFPEGPGNATIDLRYSTPLADTHLLNESPAQGDLGIKDAQMLAPGDPARSILVARMATLGAERMPNIGSHWVDERGVALLSAWIESMGAGER